MHATAAPGSPRETHKPTLRISGLVKDYGRVHAVRGIDLEVRRGEVFGFLGPNGAGKTTTIRCVLDLLRPTSGVIEVLGLDPRRDGVQVRQRVAYVPGELRLPERQTGRQLVAAISRLRGGLDSAPCISALYSFRDRSLGRLAEHFVRIKNEFSGHTGVKLLVSLWRVVQADHRRIHDPGDRQPVMQDGLHQLPVITQHRRLACREAERLRPSQSEAHPLALRSPRPVSV